MRAAQAKAQAQAQAEAQAQALVMTLIHAQRPYVVHGKPLPIANATAFVGAHTYGSVLTHSWIVDVWRPHSCGVRGCHQNRARLCGLWACVAQRVHVVNEAARALRVRLPTEIAEHALSFVGRKT